MEIYLGIDVGSITTKLAALRNDDQLVASIYLPTGGAPAEAVPQALKLLRPQLPGTVEVKGTAATGSGRYLAGAIIGADMVKNEITCQAAAALRFVPEAQTIIEIGGQDSKIIIIRNGLVTDFGMNTVCAAGTGSFLDHQAARLHLTIEEFSRRALHGKDNTPINGRCTVFAESDMIHKQQTGHKPDDIIYGLCRALVRNFLGDVSAGKEIRPPVVFQGGVAFNGGIVRALREELGMEIIVPTCHEVMGAIGAALLAHENSLQAEACRFKGFEVSEGDYQTTSFVCPSCPSSCEIIRLTKDDKTIDYWGGRCYKWEKTYSDRSINEDRG